jgi:hypothetical protein
VDVLDYGGGHAPTDCAGDDSLTELEADELRGIDLGSMHVITYSPL